MTTLYAMHNASVVIFDTEDDYPYVIDRLPPLPFHMFRSAEKGTELQALLSILEFAINTISDTDGINYKSNHTNIVGKQYKRIEFRGIKMSLFEHDNSLIAISTLSIEGE